MKQQIVNRAETFGTFEQVPVENYTELTVKLTALEIEKAADKKIWVKDQLTYTITVTNVDDRDPLDPVEPGMPVTEARIEDVIDPEIATLVPNSVEIDGVPAADTEYSFNPVTGLLIVTIGEVVYGTPRVVTFRVSMV